MTSIDKIFKEILEEIIPTPEELYDINEIIDVVKVLLKNSAKELSIEYTIIEPQGSTGIKQTQLRNDFDIDIFIGLDYKLYEPKYEGLSKNKLKKISKKDFLHLCNNWILKSLILEEFKDPGLSYAEHPYVTVDFVSYEKNLKIKLDIVLYFDLPLDYIQKNGPITAVDRSPWHGRFVMDNLSKDQKDEVRLLKQFFKCCHSYGDKSAVGKGGFIGYSAELLIYRYKTTQKVFENFHDLDDIPIDYFNRNMSELRKKPHFQNDYLIITDPVDKNRNVASAISERAYKYCNQKVKDFFKNPDDSFFRISQIPEAEVSKLDDFYIVEIKSKDDDEVHYTINRDKLYSLGDRLKSTGENELSHKTRFGNIIFELYFEGPLREYNLAIFCEKPIISESYMRRGPPVQEKKHVDKFKQKNPNYIEKDGFLWVETKRKFIDFLEYVKDFIKDRIPENLEIVNISKASGTKTTSGKRALFVLKHMVLPFI